MKSGRIALIDELRGFALINMIVYHLLYDLTVIYGVDIPWFSSRQAGWWQEYICISFILIAGIVIPFAHSALKHAIVVTACAIGISLVTYAFMPDQFIFFGILHMLGISMLLYVMFSTLFRRVNNIIGFIVSLGLIVLTWHVTDGYIGIGSWMLQLPEFTSRFLFPLGLASESMSSADYFPLLPYFFVFTAGVFLSDWVKKWPQWTRKTHIRPFEYIGQHSLVIYLLHNPVILSCLYLYFNFIAG